MIRDWRQCWDPNAEFVLIKPVQKFLGRDYGVGDVLTPAMRKHLGYGDLLAWWKAGLIAIKGGPGSPPANELPTDTKLPEAVTIGPSVVTTPETPTPLKKKRGRPSKADLAARAALTADGSSNPN